MQARLISHRRGVVKLHDLVALGAILLVAGAMLPPALRQVREAALLKQCATNLRQIGIASHNYHSDFSKLPPGYFGPVFKNGNTTDVAPDKATDRGPWVGCLVLLLPYMEQDNLYKHLWTTATTYPPEVSQPAMEGFHCGLPEERKAWWTQKENLESTTGQVRLKMFQCPSDKATEEPTEGVLYATHLTGGKFLTVIGPKNLGRTNYTGVAGSAGRLDGQPAGPDRLWSIYEGIYTNRSTLTLGQLTVQDGTSNTLMFGESLGGSGGDKRDRAWSWFGVGAMGTGYGLGRGDKPAPAEPPAFGSKTPAGQDGSQWYRFGSRHERVVQFCYGDCSVRGVLFGSTTQYGHNDWYILAAMSGRKDGDNRDISPLFDK